MYFATRSIRSQLDSSEFHEQWRCIEKPGRSAHHRIPTRTYSTLVSLVYRHSLRGNRMAYYDRGRALPHKKRVCVCTASALWSPGKLSFVACYKNPAGHIHHLLFVYSSDGVRQRQPDVFPEFGKGERGRTLEGSKFMTGTWVSYKKYRL